MNESLFHLLYSFGRKSAFLDVLVVFLAQYLLYFMIPAAIALIFLEADFKKRYYFLSLATLSVILSAGVVLPTANYLYQNPRPFAALATVEPLINHSTNSSIPSGHMMFIVPIALTVFYVNKRVGAWFVGLAAAMGVARVIAGVHWPLDILAGFLIGSLCFFAAKWIMSLGGLRYAQNEAKVV